MNHLYWFAYHTAYSASVRYRGLYVVEYLKREFNYSCDFVVPGYSLRNVLRFIRLFFEIVFYKKKAAVIVIQKVHSNGLYANALKLLIRLARLPVVYDIDDAEYLRSDTKSLHYFLKRADVCSVGSQSLKNYCSKFNSCVVVNTSPVIDHTAEKTGESSTFTIGWIGGYNTNNPVSEAFSHKRSLNEIFFPALFKLEQPIHLLLLGVTLDRDVEELRALFQHKKNISLEIPMDIHWLNEAEVYERIARCDLGVAPLVDHPFNQAKSAFKAKQYLSGGVPVLASNVGENGRFVHHGHNGYLCNSADEFAMRIEEFMEMDMNTRQKFSTCAKASMAEFDMAGYCDVIRGIIKNIVTSASPITVETGSTHITSRHPKGAWIADESAQHLS